MSGFDPGGSPSQDVDWEGGEGGEEDIAEKSWGGTATVQPPLARTNVGFILAVTEWPL